ncbi:MAG: helix-turn-helix transcriptional regulator [Alphaproteobacteria bacterium]|nr:helix-turn-helix transcriptional regulator [Alphaproteobacteria bacterium]
MAQAARRKRSTAQDGAIVELEANSRRASALLRAMSNERRLVILCQLAHGGEKSVGALAKAVGLRQSALSQHLARLRQDGLVRTRRSAQTIYYALASGAVAAVIDTLYTLYCNASGATPRRAHGSPHRDSPTRTGSAP